MLSLSLYTFLYYPRPGPLEYGYDGRDGAIDASTTDTILSIGVPPTIALVLVTALVRAQTYGIAVHTNTECVAVNKKKKKNKNNNNNNSLGHEDGNGNGNGSVIGMGVGRGMSEEEVWQALELCTGTIPSLPPTVSLCAGLTLLELMKEVMMVGMEQHRYRYR